ncbi:hypothetical protein [Citrobacter freundii]|uniref:hypothetical protein n=1 Tax=Citrobacter freundii TaxID=546 RepID=UPI00397B9843
MDNNEQNVNRVVSAPEIIDFINKNATAPIFCPSCQKQDWITIAPNPQDVNEPTPIEMIMIGTYDPKTGTLVPFPTAAGEPIIRVMCNNCAYTMFYSYMRLKELILNQTSKAEG